MADQFSVGEVVERAQTPRGRFLLFAGITWLVHSDSSRARGLPKDARSCPRDPKGCPRVPSVCARTLAAQLPSPKLPVEADRCADEREMGGRSAGSCRAPRRLVDPHGGRPGVRAPGRRLRARAAPTPRVVMTGLPTPVGRATPRIPPGHGSRFIRVSWTCGSRRSAPHRLWPRAGVADTSCHSGTKGTVDSRPLPMAPLHLGSPWRSAAERLGASSLGFDMARCRHYRSRTGRCAYRLGLACWQTGRGAPKISSRRRPRDTPPGRAQSRFI